jgi:hypothetical protein
MYDWIETYMEETSSTSAPMEFRLWSAITAISGVLERKVWTHGMNGPIYPNLFTVLVGSPGVGKNSAINPVRNLWAQVKGLQISPSNVTKAALIDALAKALRTVPTADGKGALIFSCLVVPAPEFGVFFPSHDTAFLSVLNEIYDSQPIYREERRTHGAVEITKPYLVLLSGTQPDFLSQFFPDAAWGQGFTSRTIMIYSEGGPVGDIIGKGRATTNNGLVVHLQKMSELVGEIHWTQEAANEINAWHRMKCPPMPEHSKLTHYCPRRSLHVIKLSIISAISRGGKFEIGIEDFERARDWLLTAEAVMPDIFRAMGARNDEEVVKELHLHLHRLWSSVAVNKRKPLPSEEIWKYLLPRVTSDRIPKLIDTAEKTGYIRRGRYPDEWEPRPMTSHFGSL